MSVSSILILYMIYCLYWNINMSTLIKKLQKGGWKVYVNTNNCGYCIEQIRFFKNYLPGVSVVHCDDVRNVCQVDALPTWENSQGKRIHGAKLKFEAFSEF